MQVGDVVEILDYPINPDMKGKIGIIRHKEGIDLYRVEVDGKVIPDYALPYVKCAPLLRSMKMWINLNPVIKIKELKHGTRSRKNR